MDFKRDILRARVAAALPAGVTNGKRKDRPGRPDRIRSGNGSTHHFSTGTREKGGATVTVTRNDVQRTNMCAQPELPPTYC